MSALSTAVGCCCWVTEPNDVKDMRGTWVGGDVCLLCKSGRESKCEWVEVSQLWTGVDGEQAEIEGVINIPTSCGKVRWMRKRYKGQFWGEREGGCWESFRDRWKRRAWMAWRWGWRGSGNLRRHSLLLTPLRRLWPGCCLNQWVLLSILANNLQANEAAEWMPFHGNL